MPGIYLTPCGRNELAEHYSAAETDLLNGKSLNSRTTETLATSHTVASASRSLQ